jgi:hypothetical protein
MQRASNIVAVAPKNRSRSLHNNSETLQYYKDIIAAEFEPPQILDAGDSLAAV